MNATKQGELFVKMLTDKNFKKQVDEDLEKYYYTMPQVKRTNDPEEIVSRLVSGSGAGLNSGQKFIDKALENGYDALFDKHGTNISKSPIIVLNPDTNLKEISKPEYT